MNWLKRTEHGIKAVVFRLMKRLLKVEQSDFQPLDCSQLNRILFLRPEKIGDMVISFPVFDGLISRYPHLKLSIVGSPSNRAVIEQDPRFETVYLYTKRIWSDIKMLRHIRRKRFDCVVDMICDDSVTALFLSQLSAPGKPRIGVGKIRFQEYYDYNYDHRMGNRGHIIENTLKLLNAFGIDPEKVSHYAPPYISTASNELANTYIAQITTNQDRCLIGINLSAGSATRIWQKEKSIELLRQIATNYPQVLAVLLSTPSERDRAEYVHRSVPESTVMIPDGLSLMDVTAIIAKFELLITPDTSLVHIARSMHVPVVGLYTMYQKNYMLWRPFGQDGGTVVSSHDDNIHDITVEQVYNAFVEVIDFPKAMRKE